MMEPIDWHENFDWLTQAMVKGRSDDRWNLHSGTTIDDVYAQFDDDHGPDHPVRSCEELRDVIQNLHVRYENCDSISVSHAWVAGETDDPDAVHDPLTRED